MIIYQTLNSLFLVATTRDCITDPFEKIPRRSTVPKATLCCLYSLSRRQHPPILPMKMERVGSRSPRLCPVNIAASGLGESTRRHTYKFSTTPKFLHILQISSHMFVLFHLQACGARSETRENTHQRKAVLMYLGPMWENLWTTVSCAMRADPSSPRLFFWGFICDIRSDLLAHVVCTLLSTLPWLLLLFFFHLPHLHIPSCYFTFPSGQGGLTATYRHHVLKNYFSILSRCIASSKE